jgi:hypothetical protein
VFGIIKKLFGTSEAGSSAAIELESVEYNGFQIVPMPRKESQGFRVQGRIEKVIDGELRKVSFVRADMYHAQDDTVAVILQKGRRLIEEQGDRLFDDAS